MTMVKFDLRKGSATCSLHLCVKQTITRVYTRARAYMYTHTDARMVLTRLPYEKVVPWSPITRLQTENVRARR